MPAQPQFQSYIRGLARQWTVRHNRQYLGQFDARNLAIGNRRLDRVSNEEKSVGMSDTFALAAANEKVLSRVSMTQIEQNIQFGRGTVVSA